MKKQFLAVAAISALLGSAMANASVTLLDKDNWKVQMNGFVEADMIHDSTRSFGEVVGSNFVDRPGTYKGDNGRTQFSNRNSRLAFTLLPPIQNDWKSKGVLEFDLFGYEPNVGTSSPNMSETSFYQSPAMRLRLAYLTNEKDSWQFTAGQAWSLFGWQPSFFPATLSVFPEAGEICQRTLQFLAINTMAIGGSSKIQTAASMERPSQRDSQVPNFNLGVKYSLDSLRAGFVSAYGDEKTEPLSVGLSGAFKQFTTPSSTTATNTQNHYNSSAVAVDVLIPIIPSADGKDTGNTLIFSGEFTSGTGYADALANWSGGLIGFASNTSVGNVGDKTNLDAGHAGFDANANFNFVKLQTWNASFQYHFSSESKLYSNLGYAEIFSSNVGDLTQSASAASAVYDKSSSYYINLIKDVTNQTRLGFEYSNFVTHYFSDKSTAANDRYQITALFRF